LLLKAECRIVGALELAFSTKSIRELCENQARARERLGGKVAEKLKRRLADMRSAASVADLVAGSPQELDGADTGDYVVNLHGTARIRFCANHNCPPRLQSERVDWTKVSRILIKRIEHDHI
jgi:hypothetical protein